MKTLTLEHVAPARHGTELLRCWCGTPTCCRKLVCERHIFELPYPASLAREALERDEELRHAARGRLERIDVDGGRAREILAFLDMTGERSIGSLVHELDFTGARFGKSPMQLLRAYIDALERAGLVVILTLTDRQGRVRSTVRLA